MNQPGERRRGAAAGQRRYQHQRRWRGGTGRRRRGVARMQSIAADDNTLAATRLTPSRPLKRRDSNTKHPAQSGPTTTRPDSAVRPEGATYLQPPDRARHQRPHSRRQPETGDRPHCTPQSVRLETTTHSGTENSTALRSARHDTERPRDSDWDRAADRLSSSQRKSPESLPFVPQDRTVSGRSTSQAR